MIQSCPRCRRMYDDAVTLDACPHREYELVKVAKRKPQAVALGWDETSVTYIAELPALVAVRSPYLPSQRLQNAMRKWAHAAALPMVLIGTRRTWADVVLWFGETKIETPRDARHRAQELYEMYGTCGWTAPGSQVTVHQYGVSFERVKIGPHLDTMIDDLWALARDFAATAKAIEK